METLGPKPSPHLKWKGSIPLEYRYTAGIAGQKFLSSIKDRRKIIGSKCDKCGDRRVPPRIYCVNCFSQINTYVDLEGEWEVYSFGVETRRGRRTVYALLKFPGVRGGLIHRLVVRPKDVEVLMRVRPVFKKARKGSILDIEGFEPAL